MYKCNHLDVLHVKLSLLHQTNQVAQQLIWMGVAFRHELIEIPIVVFILKKTRYMIKESVSVYIN